MERCAHGENKIPIRRRWRSSASSRGIEPLWLLTLGSSLVAAKSMRKILPCRRRPGNQLAMSSSLGTRRKLARPRPIRKLQGYLETHRTRADLEAIGKRIGLVTHRRTEPVQSLFTGQADHSARRDGMRKDALVAAALLIESIETTCRRFSSMAKGRVVGTVGAMKIEPGVINAVPGRTELLVDIRAITAQAKNRVARLVKAQAQYIARQRAIGVEVLTIREEDPVPLDKRLLRLTQQICDARQIIYEIMPSGAGHDAMQMPRSPRRDDFIPATAHQHNDRMDRSRHGLGTH